MHNQSHVSIYSRYSIIPKIPWGFFLAHWLARAMQSFKLRLWAKKTIMPLGVWGDSSKARDRWTSSDSESGGVDMIFAYRVAYQNTCVRVLVFSTSWIPSHERALLFHLSAYANAWQAWTFLECADFHCPSLFPLECASRCIKTCKKNRGLAISN